MRFMETRDDEPTDVDLAALREAVASYPLSLVVVFGSHAHGTVGPLSDLDVAVEFETDVDREHRLALLDELTAAIGRATGVEAVDLVDLDSVGPALGYEALSTSRLVHGDPGTAVERESRFLQRKLDFQPVKREWDAALVERVREGQFGRP